MYWKPVIRKQQFLNCRKQWQKLPAHLRLYRGTPSSSPTTHTEPLHLEQFPYSFYPRKAQSSQDIVCSSNLYSQNQPAAKETQSTLVPIPKRHAWHIYPESGFEARYERLLIFWEWKTPGLLALSEICRL